MFFWPSECSSWLWLCCERWETMRNASCHNFFATIGRKTLERNQLLPKKWKENCFQQSFDCLFNDRKCAVYCHLGMKLAWCMLDKSRRRRGELAGGQIKQPRLKFLGRPREVFASAESDSDTQRGRGIIQLGQQGFKEVCRIGKNWDQKSHISHAVVHLPEPWYNFFNILLTFSFYSKVWCFEWKKKNRKAQSMIFRKAHPGQMFKYSDQRQNNLLWALQ